MDRAGNPPPNVLLMVAMALTAWGLVYMAATSVWSWHTQLSKTIIGVNILRRLPPSPANPKQNRSEDTQKLAAAGCGAHHLRHGFFDRRVEPLGCVSQGSVPWG